MSESPEQSTANPEANTGNDAPPAGNPAPPAASQQQPPANPRPENSAAKLLQDVHTAISALPEQLANVLNERKPESVRQTPPPAKQAAVKQEQAKQEPAQPQKKTFAERWFGL